MSTCRNQLMNEGKPYGKSSCGICGSILFGGTCKLDVKPNPLAGSNLDERHYVAVKDKVTSMDKYAVILEKSYSESDTYGDYTTTKYKDFLPFDSEEHFKAWYIENQQKQYGGQTVLQVIRYSDVKVKTQVEVSFV